MKKSLLAITGVFMPHNDTITQITYKHLCNLDYDIDVVSFKSEKDLSMEKILSSDKKFKKFHIHYLNRDWKKVYVSKSNFNIFSIFKNMALFNKKSLSMIKNKKYDILYSNSVPNYTHYAAYLIKKKLGKNIKWYASFSDPIIDNPYVEAMKRKNIFTKDMLAYFLQKIIHYRKKYQNLPLKYADKLIFISEELRDYYIKGDEKLLKKSIVIPITYVKEWPMYKDLLELKSINNKEKSNNKIKFMHFGNIYGLRKIDLFIQAISELKNEIDNFDQKIEIHQYGNIEQNQLNLINKYNIQDIFKVHKRVDYNQCLKLMQKEADVLVVFDTILREDKIQPFLPSKTIEYLLTQKPIFSVTTKNSPTYRLLNNSHICASYNIVDMKQAILKQLKNVKGVSTDYTKYENTYVINSMLGKELDICEK